MGGCQNLDKRDPGTPGAIRLLEPPRVGQERLALAAAWQLQWQ